MDFALMSGFTALPFFIYDHLGGGTRMSGTILGTVSLFYAITCLLSRRIVARSSNGLRWALAGCLWYMLLVPTVPCFRTPILVCGVFVCGFMGMGLFWPAMQAWIGAEPDVAVRKRRLAWFNVSWSLGLALGPPVAGYLYGMTYWLPFLAVFCGALAAFALVCTLPSEKSLHGDVMPPIESERTSYDSKSEAHLYCAWGANLVSWAMVAVMRAVFSKRIHTLVGTSPWENQLQLWPGVELPDWMADWSPAFTFSWLLLTLYATRAIISLMLGSTHAWQHRFWVLAASQLLAAAAFWVLGKTTGFGVMILCCVALGLSGGVSYFASLSYGMANRERKHVHSAIHESTVGVGSFLGAVVFGDLAERFGVTWPLLYTPWMIVAAIGIQALLLRHGLRKQANQCRM
jgi:MFS family permease